MNPRVERRKEILINAAFVAFLLAMFYLFMEYAFTLLFPFLTAALFAVVLQKPINKITQKTPLKKGFVSVILVLALAIALAALIAVLVLRVYSEVKGLVSLIYSKMAHLPIILTNLRGELFRRIGFLPDSAEETVRRYVTEWTDKIIYAGTENSTLKSSDASNVFHFFTSMDFSFLKKPIAGIMSTAKQIPSLILATVITIVASCFMCMEYDHLVNFIKRQISTRRSVEDLSRAKQMFLSSAGKILRTYATIMLITFAEITIGLYALKLFGVYKGGYILIIAALTALVDIFPVLGTGTVLIPWALIAFLIGSPWLGLGILILYACITVIRQVLEPKLVASNLGISPILSLMGLYLGLKLFGFFGMIIMPMLLTMIKLLNDEGIIHLWIPSQPPKKAAAEGAEETAADAAETGDAAETETEEKEVPAKK